jgi:signal transduction histidine kinase/ActR/RegA family two-component response regulator
MRAWFSEGPLGWVRHPRPRNSDATRRLPAPELSWRALPTSAQVYVVSVIVLGAAALAAFFPATFPRPVAFSILLILACLLSIWKVNLPIPLVSGATLSASDAASLMTLFLLGPHHAMFVAVTAVYAQSTLNVRQPYPPYRTLFNAAAEAITMAATGLVYWSLGGSSGSFAVSSWAAPVAGATATCFCVNTGLVAGAIGLSTSRRVWRVWRDDFLWCAVSFMVTGGAGALAALVVDRGEYVNAVLMLVPVYLTYRTYRLFFNRLEDEQTRNSGAVESLSRRVSEAREIERGLTEERARLAQALAAMTELEEMHTQLLEREQAARANAEQANIVKDQFLATVSHELRTPLNAILGWADMLRNDTLDVTRRDRAGRAIYTSAKRQAQLINELLDVARIMSGKLQLEFAPVDLKDVARCALDIVQPDADAKQISIGIDEDPSIGNVYGDSGRLNQVAINLLANAVKFTPEGGTVYVRLRRVDDTVEMVVTDTGKGIAPEFLTSVFEPFRQADAATTRVHGGLGLGLSIVKYLVEAHGGTVRADSAGRGQGATFTVRLPVAAVCGDQIEAVAADLSPVESGPDDASDSLHGISVLVVDDDDDSRQVMEAHLERHGAHVVTAASAAAALKLLQREHVDVLLSDVAMPGEDGYTLIRKVRGLNTPKIASTPAVAVTAFAHTEDRQRALQAGFQLHLAKPVDTHELIAVVAKLGKTSPT